MFVRGMGKLGSAQIGEKEMTEKNAKFLKKCEDSEPRNLRITRKRSGRCPQKAQNDAEMGGDFVEHSTALGRR
jgi:hypothetical protein